MNWSAKYRENPNLQGVSGEWIDIVKGCLVKDHGRRWAAIDVLTAIASIGISIPQNKPPTIPKPQPSSQKTQPAPIVQSSSGEFLVMTMIIGLVSSVAFLGWQNTRIGSKSSIISSPYSTSTPSSESSSVASNVTSSPSTNATISSETAGKFFISGYEKHFKKNDLQGAITDYNEAIRLNPSNAGFYYIRGVAKSASGDKQGAITDYNEAIRLNPSGASGAYYGRGIVKYDLGDNQGAIADYNEAIRLNPNDADAYYNRGNAKYALGDNQGAIADYNETIRLNPNYANAYYNRAILYKQLGEKQKALADYRESARIYQQQGKITDYEDAQNKIRELGG